MSSSEKQSNWLESPTISDKILKILVILAIIVALPDILSVFHIVLEMHP